MPLRVGTTEIATVGKVKLGTTNITKIFRGSTQIWPVQAFSFPAGSLSSTDGAGGCAFDPTGSTVYSNVASPTIGNIIYTNSSLTTVLVGGNQWYAIGGNMFGYSWQINNSGVIVANYDCGF